MLDDQRDKIKQINSLGTATWKGKMYLLDFYEKLSFGNLPI